jgi:hypothetical protein
MDMGKKYDHYQYPTPTGDLPKFHFIDKNTILFFDVVSFSKDMSFSRMENIIIKIDQSIDKMKRKWSWNKTRFLSKNHLIMLPTGDGYGIAFNPNDFSDKEVMEISYELLNKLTKETGFKIKFGIASGSVVRYLDANGMVNLFGTGVILAYQVMNEAGENQVFVHETVAVGLRNSPPFGKRLHGPYTIKIKHKREENVYIYKYPGCRNMTPPT